MLYNLKKKLSKAYTAITSVIVVVLLFILQFVVFEGNLEFWKDWTFWMSLAVMVVILLLGNEIYWRNGSNRAEANDKYISSAIEYSVRINRIKNNSPCLTDDFYKYIDELNIALFIEARNKLLEDASISKDDYYYGHLITVLDEDGNTITKYSTPHCELTKKQLQSLKRQTFEGVENYYTKKQIKTILQAVSGKFKYEVISATEVLSGISISNKKYAVGYNANKNKKDYVLTNLGSMLILSVTGALLGADLVKNGWSAAALFTFFYRVFMFAWRALTSDEAGYRDIVDTKRGVNVNRSNLTTMFATARGYTTLFDSVNDEIQATKALYLKQMGVQEVAVNGNNK